MPPYSKEVPKKDWNGTTKPPLTADGHSHRQSDTDVQLLPGTVAEVQHRAVPDAVRAVQLPCLLDSLVYILPVVHVHDSLEHEALGLGILLSAHIVLENAVVGTEEDVYKRQG